MKQVQIYKKTNDDNTLIEIIIDYYDVLPLDERIESIYDEIDEEDALHSARLIRKAYMAMYPEADVVIKIINC